jgi:hypothetical protein
MTAPIIANGNVNGAPANGGGAAALEKKFSEWRISFVCSRESGLLFYRRTDLRYGQLCSSARIRFGVVSTC